MELLVAMLVLVPLPAVLQLMARARQRRRRESLWVDHPVQLADLPFRGYKVAQLIVGPNNAWLAGVMGARYTVDAHASCLRGSCTPPEVSCHCGFYAFRDRTSALALIGQLGSIHPARSYVLLTVDLDGDVLEYEHGSERNASALSA